MANLSTYYPLPIVAGTTAGTFADGASAAHVGLANTFTANQTLNGTNNVAPNQTAASGSSLLTRDLGDARYFQRLQAFLTANQTITSQTVLQDVTNVALSLTAGAWEILFTFQASMASTAPGITYRFDSTQTPTIINAFERRGSTGGNISAVSVGMNANRMWNGFTSLIHQYSAFVQFSSASTIKLQFAQSASSADAVTILAGSRVSAYKVS